ncbi:AAA family ATPase [Staphylococcus delphini]|uniref:AAA+ ATPase domain-containing protein n=3 Tax=Staphylococcus delphini TaxID=53344 RepID=A0AAX0QQA8_9STAP|nr:AAA family ATPase [Staphylococcus delphini]PCF46154.1 hypothetical protein B5C07_12665 [Staphylococcus delphini]RIZ49085.1 hypothetical protein CDL68_12370 [Staphylococcus delphini]VED63048.1 recombination protein F [Staphylococcus delphini]
MDEKIIINKLHIEKFRELEDVYVNFGRKLTVISGRNGTGKSSLLGLVSQFLSFRNVNDRNDINYKTLFNEDFESEFKNHLKISEKYDTPDKKYKINIFLEGKSKLYTLSTTKRDNNHIRFVLRGNEDRNFTWPSSYLDLRRLTPMVYRKEDEEKKLELDGEDKKLLIEWTNSVIPKIEKSENISTNIPEKDIKSASSGEDNVGQILITLLSFKKLKENYKAYNGGIVLIDELDATLFPKSQLKLLDLLLNLAGKYSLQIIFTTHSPTMLNYIYELKQKTEKNSRTSNDIAVNYLTNTRGKTENMNFESFGDIVNDLEFKTTVNKANNDRKINVYCEDIEAKDMLKRILNRDIKSQINIESKVTLGAEQYISLIKANVTEFKKNSIIVLDGDKKFNYENVIKLPFSLPPDQIVYKFFEDEPAESQYWENDLKFNKTNFAANETVNAIRHNLEYDNGKYVLREHCKENKRVREYFKEFYKDDEIKRLLNTRGCNVFTILKNKQKKEIEKFNNDFLMAINYVKSNIYIN